MRITDEFRRSMNWTHTWLGIALSGVLFAIFRMGSLSVFHPEINKWMIPEDRILANTDVDLDPIITPLLEERELSESAYVLVQPPSERKPWTFFMVIDQGEREMLYLHPETGEPFERTRA